MKNINILSLSQAASDLSPDAFSLYKKHYGIDIKNNEVSDLQSLVSRMYQITPFVNLFNEFYVGYKIQHISKEFDLLRFGENYIINIELKNSSSEDKISKQLYRNRYYLNHINKNVHNFTYVVSTNTLYRLDNINGLQKVGIDLLIQLLGNQKLLPTHNPDDLFNPSDYLVSPFNSTDKFVHGHYFLTNQQEEFKKNITNKLVSSNATEFFAITGGAGTGKTLLTYDIARSMMPTHRCLIVHCGNLNQGHYRLNELGWNIIPIKNLGYQNLYNFDLVILDEAQRIKSYQLNNLIPNALNANTNVIFSYDQKQTLSSSEAFANIEGKIDNIANVLKCKLSDKIRTNKEIANFIKLIFNSKRSDVSFSDCGNVDFEYFTNSNDVKNYTRLISSEGWEVLKLTASLKNPEYHQTYSDNANSCSHEVIGQEFDNVAVIMDQYFSYDGEGKLTYNSKTYYDSVRMLFQNITRTRKKLKIIIIQNGIILNRCMDILG
ncbi:ATP-binding protein [Vibrio parahaemolyticus]|uniref:ATP-binding protein n=1 Tax=Vibrio parahaemolyticus TaxID=670 RepID=UPI0004D89522|nr:ATP-binding protein [Vibrio parahaemolyticus]OQU28516.1 hypothetical protein EN05_019890 [Vibrio parahaemolyticus]